MNKELEDRRKYSLKPILVEASLAHQEGLVSYISNGTVTFKHPELSRHTKKKSVLIKPNRQFPLIRATFDALNKPLSNVSNSPRDKDGKSLRKLYEEELETYEEKVTEAYINGDFEPDYGNYLYDHKAGNLFLLAPEKWHRLALVTSPSKLLTEPDRKNDWYQLRNILENFRVGFVGASVGGVVLEGWFKDGRPKMVKVADNDALDITNLSRASNGSIEFLSLSRAARDDFKNPYETNGVNKAEIAAYRQHLIDPYSEIYVYPEGIDRTNIERFILGDGKLEPGIDLLVEETDNLRLKVEVRQTCKKYEVPVLMMSDFGHIAQGQFQDYKKHPETSLGYRVTDQELLQAFDILNSNPIRENRLKFIKALCGPDFLKDEFGMWIRGEGEMTTSSIPQLGSTAMVSGGIGGKVIALYALGHQIPERFLFDSLNREIILG